VESVIQLRRAGALRDGYGHDIAAACLRLIGLGAAEVARARGAAGLAAPPTGTAGPAAHLGHSVS
jgi:hypothetical protein